MKNLFSMDEWVDTRNVQIHINFSYTKGTTNANQAGHLESYTTTLTING